MPRRSTIWVPRFAGGESWTRAKPASAGRLALKPDFAGAHDNLGTVLWEQGKLEEAEASIRRALALAPGFTRALDNLGSMLKDQGRLNEAIAVYRQLLQIRPRGHRWAERSGACAGRRRRRRGGARDSPQSLRIRETASAKRIFVDIVKQLRWANDNARRQARHAMARALTEPWARPDELARTAPSLIKQNARIGACVARAAQAWPRSLSALELFGPGGPRYWRTTDCSWRCWFRRRTPTSNSNASSPWRGACCLRRQRAMGPRMARPWNFTPRSRASASSMNMSFSASEEEITACGQAARCADRGARDRNADFCPCGCWRWRPIFRFILFPARPGSLDRTWPEQVTAVLVQQVREPQEEAQLRATIPRLTSYRGCGLAPGPEPI